MSHIFISYAHTDQEYARKLADHLIANGFDVWIDDRIDFGSRWVRSIFEALEACAAFIVIMTPRAYESEFVEKEYLHAGNLDKPSFPLLLEGRAFPYFVGIQYYDVQGGKLPTQDFFEDLARFAPRSAKGRDVATKATQEIKQAPSPDATGEYLTTLKESVVHPAPVSPASVPEPDEAPRNVTKEGTKQSRGSFLLASGAVLITLAVILALVLVPRGDDPNSGASGTTPTAAATNNVLPTSIGGGHGEIAFVSYRDDNHEIYLLNADGDLHNLTNDPADDADPAWSPDGSQLAFTSNRINQDLRIFIMNADGSNAHPLIGETAGWDASWSPDGMQIIFTAYSTEGDGLEEIYVVGVDGSDLHALTDNSFSDGYGVWSPDGSKIAYVSNPNGNQDIYVMDADGSNPYAVTDDPADDRNPAWSPDGTRIAFESDRIGYSQICVTDVDGSDQMCSPDTGDGYEPSWAPDGTMIVYASYRDSNGGRELYLMDTDGNVIRRITDDPAEDTFPTWRP